MKKQKIWFAVLCAAACACFAGAGVSGAALLTAASRNVSAPSLPALQLSGVPAADTLPVFSTDELFISEKRAAYTDGDMLLVVPKLELSVPVLGGTAEVTLENGVGLFENAQLPGEGQNSNVSIAGHRGAYGCEFLHIDTLGSGDEFYLFYGGNCYTYTYSATNVVQPDDWTYIYCGDKSVLTLMSCHPLLTGETRMFVTATLSGIRRA